MVEIIHICSVLCLQPLERVIDHWKESWTCGIKKKATLVLQSSIMWYLQENLWVHLACVPGLGKVSLSLSLFFLWSHWDLWLLLETMEDIAFCHDHLESECTIPYLKSLSPSHTDQIVIMVCLELSVWGVASMIWNNQNELSFYVNVSYSLLSLPFS